MVSAASIGSVTVYNEIFVFLVGAGMGLAGGVTGGAAAISETILNSQQMKAAKEALAQDQDSTSELQTQMEALSKNEKLMKKLALRIAKSGGSISGNGYEIARLVGLSSSNLLSQGLTTMAGTFSDKAAKAVSQAFLVASTRAVTGAFSIVTGGVTMVYDFYQLSGQIDTLVSNGGAESASQIRSIAAQLKKNLYEIKENGEGADSISKECI